MLQDELRELRCEIDSLDDEILNVLNKRMRISQQIGRVKSRSDENVQDESRERIVIERLRDANPGPISETALRAVYREIFSGSRALQIPESVAFLGPEGAYSHEAALKRFGSSAVLLPCSSISEAFAAVERAQVTLGLVPAENTIEGSVRETLDRLMKTPTSICGETALRIVHCLMNATGKSEDVRVIASHPQALAQCRAALAGAFPGVGLRETLSTATAAELARDDHSIAAVASETAATRLGLPILARGIQDETHNVTRFFILGRKSCPPTGADKTSVIFRTEDQPGALARILNLFAEYAVNLSHIESRPDRSAFAWKYVFFVDLDGHRDDDGVSKCLQAVARSAEVRILGSYPRGDTPQEI